MLDLAFAALLWAMAAVILALGIGLLIAIIRD